MYQLLQRRSFIDPYFTTFRLTTEVYVQLLINISIQSEFDKYGRYIFFLHTGYMIMASRWLYRLLKWINIWANRWSSEIIGCCILWKFTEIKNFSSTCLGDKASHDTLWRSFLVFLVNRWAIRSMKIFAKYLPCFLLPVELYCKKKKCIPENLNIYQVNWKTEPLKVNIE